MPEELFVVNVVAEFGGSRSLFTDRDKALDYAEAAAKDPEVKYAEVRTYNTLDLISDALAELDEAAAQDEDIENGELVGRFE